MTLLSDIGLTIPLFARGANGVPQAALAVPDLAGRCDSYEHTIAARGGFESMRTGFACDLDEAIEIFNTWLGRSTIVSSPDALTIWEGQLSDITITLGQRQRSISLDKMANRVQVHYTDAQGVRSTTASASDTDSIARYGIKYFVHSARGITATAATGIRDSVLAKYKNPPQTPSTRISTGDLGSVRVELRFRGWFWTFGWVQYNSSSTTVTATNTQIGALLSSYNAINAFFSSSTARIEATGRSDTEFTAVGQTYADKLKSLTDQGDGTDCWVLMCLENRELHFRKWAGATPSAIDYIAGLGAHQVFTTSGRVIEPWDVRPDAMYQETDLLVPGSVAYDDAARQYVERVVCSIDRNRIGVTLEPAASDSLDMRLALMG